MKARTAKKINQPPAITAVILAAERTNWKREINPNKIKGSINTLLAKKHVSHQTAQHKQPERETRLF